MVVPRALVLALVTLVGSCHPLRSIASTGLVHRPLDETCLLEVLREQETVCDAWVADNRRVLATIKIPADVMGEPAPGVLTTLRHDGPNTITVQVDEGPEDEIEILFELAWLGGRKSDQFCAYVQRLLDDLRDRVVERCGP